MDAVITYVDGLDPVWQAEYAEAVGGRVMAKRYRDWGTLKYLLRGIEKHIPSIENVYLLVTGESQVPSWIDRSVVRVVLHRDIIPERFLPTFNSTTIEMFMHRIPGLAEEFLYFNDDMFPVMDCPPEDFFRDGKAVIGFAHHLFAGGKYKKRVRNSDRQARKALGKRPGLLFVRPQHTCSPMLKSECEALFARMEERILQSLSPLREPKNLSQYLFLDYQYFTGKSINRRISNRHISLGSWSLRRIDAYLRAPERKMACINDVHMSERRAAAVQELLLARFADLFPEKSRFER